jgi:hypothetical protein
VREPFSFDWLDYDVDVDLSLPGAYGGTDFDDHGPNVDKRLQATTNGFLYAHAGAQVQLGELGASVTGEFFQYAITPSNAPAPGAPAATQGVTLAYGRYHALVAYGLADNQLVLGSGLRIVTLQVKAAGGSLTSGASLVTLDGAGPEVGAILKPNNLPFRLGVTARAPVQGTVAGLTSFLTAGAVGHGGPAVTSVEGFVLPSRATLPWEVEMGFAFQLGPRPLNPPWLDPLEMDRAVRRRIEEDRAARARDEARETAETPPAERAAKQLEIAAREQSLRLIEDDHLAAEDKRLRSIRAAREANWPRERITLYGELLVTGTSESAVSLEGFATQTMEPVGRSLSISPRSGIESEPVPNWVHARVGWYLEPSRFEEGSARQHFTLGGDVKLFPFSPWGIFGDQVWRLSVSADLAPRYQNYGIGLGAWH